MNYNDRIFTNERVVMDGNRFVGCTFIDCILSFNAEKQFSIAHSRFTRCRIEYGGNAVRALHLFQDLYHGAFPQVLEDLTERIQRGRTPKKRP